MYYPCRLRGAKESGMTRTDTDHAAVVRSAMLPFYGDDQNMMLTGRRLASISSWVQPKWSMLYWSIALVSSV